MSDAKQWWIAQGGQHEGPMTTADVKSRIEAGSLDQTAYVCGDTVPEWVPIGRVGELAQLFSSESSGFTPPAVPTQRTTAHEIDFKVQGEDLQFIEITLDPGEACVAEAGAMFYMDPNIEPVTIFGDGSRASEQEGFFGKLMSAGKRVLTGESLFMTVFSNNGNAQQRVAFSAPYPGKIMPVDLMQMGGVILAQRASFLAAAKGVQIGIAFQKRLGAGLFGGEGFILQKLEGDGLAFLHAGGTIVPRTLAAGENLRVDTGCVVALEQQVTFDIQTAGNVKTALFGGEGLFYASLTGPGRVWLQSMPFSRMADRVLSAATPTSSSGGDGLSIKLGG